MKNPFRSLLAAAFLTTTASQAHAAFLLTLSQVGTNVVATGSGTLNVTALNNQGTTNGITPYISPASALLYAGPATSSSGNYYQGVSGPASFGTGSITFSTSGTGNLAGISNNYLLVPAGYVSGSALSDTATYANATFSTLGFTPGTYTFTWGTGATADSLTVTGSVPEPSTWVLLGLSSLGLLCLKLHRRRA